MKDRKRIKKEKKYWDKLVPKYDKFIEKYWKVYKNTLLNKIYSDVDAKTNVLDVACGTGLISAKIADKAKKVWAIDIAPHMIEEAKEKAKEKGIKNIEFSVQDAYNLPFEDNVFDIVICNAALHNMKYPEKALLEIRRVLKAKGKLIVSVVGIGEKLRFKIIMAISTIIGNLPVFHKFKLDEFVNFINKSSFKVIKRERIKHLDDTMAILYIIAEKERL